MSATTEDRLWLDGALLIAKDSKDPSTKVGALIVAANNVGLSGGSNTFPDQLKTSLERLEDRETKLALMVHAEMNAIFRALRMGMPIPAGSTMYIACRGRGGLIWGGPPCTRCAVEMLQAAPGIRRIVSFPFKTVPSRWAEDLERSKLILASTGVEFIEVPLP